MSLATNTGSDGVEQGEVRMGAAIWADVTAIQSIERRLLRAYRVFEVWYHSWVGNWAMIFLAVVGLVVGIGAAWVMGRFLGFYMQNEVAGGRIGFIAMFLTGPLGAVFLFIGVVEALEERLERGLHDVCESNGTELAHAVRWALRYTELGTRPHVDGFLRWVLRADSAQCRDSPAVQALAQACRRTDVLAEGEHVAGVTQSIADEGPAGAESLASLLVKLLECRSAQINMGLLASHQAYPLPALLRAVSAIAEAPPLAPEPLSAAFAPQIQGNGMVGWDDHLTGQVREHAKRALEALRAKQADLGAVCFLPPSRARAAEPIQAAAAGGEGRKGKRSYLVAVLAVIGATALVALALFWKAYGPRAPTANTPEAVAEAYAHAMAGEDVGRAAGLWNYAYSAFGMDERRREEWTPQAMAAWVRVRLEERTSWYAYGMDARQLGPERAGEPDVGPSAQVLLEGGPKGTILLIMARTRTDEEWRERNERLRRQLREQANSQDEWRQQRRRREVEEAQEERLERDEQWDGRWGIICTMTESGARLSVLDEGRASYHL